MRSSVKQDDEGASGDVRCPSKPNGNGHRTEISQKSSVGAGLRPLHNAFDDRARTSFGAPIAGVLISTRLFRGPRAEVALDSQVGRDHRVFGVDDLVTIGTFSMLSGISVVALRHYDELGVLKPTSTDPRTGYRRYSRKQLEQAWLVAELRRIDLPLDEIRKVVDASPENGHEVLLAHRDRLRDRERDVEEMVVLTDRLLNKEIEDMTTAQDVRLVAVNIGVRSKEEMDTAAAFWEAVLQTRLEDWNGQGLSRQARVGSESHAFFFNMRVRGDDEPHHGHRAAFGIAFADLDAARQRALDAGAVEHYPPVETEDQPRHCLIEDPIGNRAVLWQG